MSLRVKYNTLSENVNPKVVKCCFFIFKCQKLSKNG